MSRHTADIPGVLHRDAYGRIVPSPSSLIFLVIVAIWAAYLLQHWIRRREALATARSVDRFSEAMRVLERHRPILAHDLRPEPLERLASNAVTAASPSRSATWRAGPSSARSTSASRAQAVDTARATTPS